MEKHRRPHQYYIDKYDRITIEALKELEVKEAAELTAVSDPFERWKIQVSHSMDFRSFKNVAIASARNRESTIRKWIAEDVRLDSLVASHRLPTGVTCNTCGGAMRFCLHFFDADSAPLLFVFECPDGHTPRKTIYPNGREYLFPKRTCKQCGYEVTEKSYKENDILFTITTCSMCGKVEKDQLELKVKPKTELPVTEEDRQQYCLSFFNAHTFYEDLENLANLSDSIDEEQKEKQLKDFYEVDKIEKLTIPALETRLRAALETTGLIKLSFDRPEMKTWTVIPFNLQDPTDRDEKKSIKAVTESIRQCLYPTNWRLVAQLDYRLGYLTGKLKAHERDDDLLKLAKEIKEVKK